MYVFLIFTFTIICMLNALVESQFPKKIKIIEYWIFAILFSLLVAFRPISVPDTYTYIDIFKNINESAKYPIHNLMVYQFDVEFGFVIFIQIFKNIFGESDKLFLFTIPIINITLITFAFKKIIEHVNKEFSDDINIKQLNIAYILMLCLYTSYFGLMYNGIVLRAGLTLSLCFCALAMYIDKKFFRMVIFYILALTFHRMALIGLFFILIYRFMPTLKRGIYLIAWLILVGMVVFRIGDKIVFTTIGILNVIVNKMTILSTFSSYLDNFVIDSQIGYKNLFFFAIGLFLLFWKVESKIYYKLINVYFVGIALMSLLNNIAGASRIYDFMTFYMIILLYLINKYGKGKRFYKWLFIFSVVLSSNVLVLSVWELL